MKKAILIFFIVTAVFSQGIEIVSMYDDTVFTEILLSYIHHDTLLFCNGNPVHGTGYDVQVVFNVQTPESPEIVSYEEPTPWTRMTDFLPYNDSIFYTTNTLDIGDYRQYFLNTLVWYSDSVAPVMVSEDLRTEPRDWSGYIIHVHDSLLLLLSTAHELNHVIYNISDPLEPEYLTEIEPYDTDYYRNDHLVLQDTLWIQLGNRTRYIVYNISEPSLPELAFVCRLDTLSPEWTPTTITQYHLMNDYMVVSGSRGYGEGTFGVIDVSNPLEPILLSFHPASRQLNWTRNNGNIVIIAESGLGDPYTEVWNFSNPNVPFLQSRFPGSSTYFYRTLFHSQVEKGIIYSSVGYNDDSGSWHYLNLCKLDFKETLTRNYSFELQTGWNILSYSLFERTSITDLLGSDYGVYIYNTSEEIYEEVDTVCPGEAFWVLSYEDTLIEYSECPNTSLVRRTLYPGWNLVGPTLVDLTAERIGRNPDILLPIFGYDTEAEEYFEADTLRLLHGYWILATDTTEIKTWEEYHSSWFF